MGKKPAVLKSQEALRFLGANNRHALLLLPRELSPQVYGRPPYVYRVEHLELVKQIMRATGLTTKAAARVAAAKISGALP